MNLRIMNKVIFVIIAIAVIVGISAVAISSNYLVSNLESTLEVTIESEDQIEPKSFTVGLDESVGFTEKP